MILRVFRAKIRNGKQAEFMKLVREQSIPGLQKQKGLIGFYPGAPLTKNDMDFTMVTLWKDIDSIKSFVGDNWKSPILTPDEVPLIEEMSAEHYEYLENS